MIVDDGDIIFMDVVTGGTVENFLKKSLDTRCGFGGFLWISLKLFTLLDQFSTKIVENSRDNC